MHFMDLNIWYQQIFTYSNKNYLPLQTTQYLLALQNFGNAQENIIGGVILV